MKKFESNLNINEKINVSIVLFSRHKVNFASKKGRVLKECINELDENRLINKILIIDNSPQNFFRNISKSSKKIKYEFQKGNNLGYGKAHNLSSFYLEDTK